MKRFVLVIVLAASVAGSGATAQVRPEVALRAATELETVKGDLKAAMTAYQKIADDRAVVRDIRARALLRLAQCHQKLGDAQARLVYERIVRDFSDQTAVVTEARGLMAKGSVRPPAQGVMTMRRVFESRDLVDSITDDGSTLAFTDWNSGNVMVRNLATGRQWTVTTQPPGTGTSYIEYGEIPILSRDGQQVAYTWCTIPSPPSAGSSGPKCNGHLYVAGTREGDPHPKLLRSGPWTTAYDWSPDGRLIAAVTQSADRLASLVIVSVSDGSVRTLKEFRDAAQPAGILFSPDGRSIAYDTSMPEHRNQPGASDVMVMSLADGAERIIAAEPSRERVVGWTPDGASVLFTREKNGSNNLYLVSAQSRDGARPVLLKGDLGPVLASMRVSSSGAVYYQNQTGGASQIMRAAIDFRNGAMLDAPALVDAGTSPSWSPDGSMIAYVSKTSVLPSARATLKLRSNRGVRELEPSLTTFGTVLWAANPNVVYTIGSDGRDDQGLWSIDLETAAATFLGPRTRQLQVSADGRYLYFFRGARGIHEFVRRDVASGAERTILRYESPVLPESARISTDGSKVYYRRPEPGATAPQPLSRLLEHDVTSGAERELSRGQFGVVQLSPDNRHVVIKETNSTEKWAAINLIPLADPSKARPLIRLANSTDEALSFVNWSPDSSAILVNQAKSESQPAQTLWLRLDGGETRRVSPQLGYGVVSPDGKSIVYSKGDSEPTRFEIWVLENVLPVK